MRNANSNAERLEQHRKVDVVVVTQHSPDLALRVVISPEMTARTSLNQGQCERSTKSEPPDSGHSSGKSLARFRQTASRADYVACRGRPLLEPANRFAGRGIVARIALICACAVSRHPVVAGIGAEPAPPGAVRKARVRMPSALFG